MKASWEKVSQVPKIFCRTFRLLQLTHTSHIKQLEEHIQRLSGFFKQNLWTVPPHHESVVGSQVPLTPAHVVAHNEENWTGTRDFVRAPSPDYRTGSHPLLHDVFESIPCQRERIEHQLNFRHLWHLLMLASCQGDPSSNRQELRISHILDWNACGKVFMTNGHWP